jgi:hypothetical protein
MPGKQHLHKTIHQQQDDKKQEAERHKHNNTELRTGISSTCFLASK